MAVIVDCNPQFHRTKNRYYYPPPSRVPVIGRFGFLISTAETRFAKLVNAANVDIRSPSCGLNYPVIAGATAKLSELQEVHIPPGPPPPSASGEPYKFCCQRATNTPSQKKRTLLVCEHLLRLARH